MKTTLKWRLSKLPTVDDITTLLSLKLLTQDEAKDILFNNETDEGRDKKSLESEIKFLRELVQKLSSEKTQVVKVIETIRQPYYSQPWFSPYYSWCSTSDLNGVITTTASLNGTGGGATYNLNAEDNNISSAMYCSSDNNAAFTSVENNFSSIKTS